MVLPSAGHSTAQQPVKHARIAGEVVALAHLPVRIERLRAIAANYGLPMTAWLPPADIALVEDPLPVCEVRYDAMIRDATLPLVLRFAEKQVC